MAISIYSRQFQFAHGNFNLLTAFSICSRQLQFTHSNFNFTHDNFNFFHGNAHGVFASLTTCQLRRPTVAMHQKSKRKIKSQCLKSIFKEKNENHKSKVDLRTSRTIGGTDLHETGTDELRPVGVRIGLHTFLFMRLHGTALKMNSDRYDFISVADPTEVTFVPV